MLHSPSVPAAGDFISAGPVSVEVFLAFQTSFLSPLQSFSLHFAILNSNNAVEPYTWKTMRKFMDSNLRVKGQVRGSPKLSALSSSFPNSLTMK